ncbi:MAG: hypothetical protein K6F05_04370 [Succinivibrio sp.]|nr:hypothetical protein [Succinivibrio sp.]
MLLLKGQLVYVLQSRYAVRQARVMGISGGLFTLRFTDNGGAVRVRRSRIFVYPDEAHAAAERHQDYASFQIRKGLIF